MAGTFEVRNARMDDFEFELNQDLAAIRLRGLFRELRRIDSPQMTRVESQGQWLLNFSSNDYLGLANDPILKEATIKAVRNFGAGAGASRLVSGSLAPHHELDETIAAFKRTEAALSFSSGSAAALGAITTLVGKDDVIVIDKLVHASIVDAARLSGANLRVFPHNDLDALVRILRRADQRIARRASSVSSSKRRPRVLIATESIFSMDGDRAPLRELVEVKESFGAWLMLDEAHATGVLGNQGRGLGEETGVSDRIEIQMGTLGKALGSSGGFLCGSRAFVDLLTNRARSFIFSTAPVPAAAAAARAAIQFIQTPDGKARREMLWNRVSQVHSGLARFRGALNSDRCEIVKGADSIKAPSPAHEHFAARIEKAPLSPIFPLGVGDEKRAVEFANAFRERGILIPAIRYPAVARGAARLRLTVTAAHTAEDVDDFLRVLQPLNITFP